MTFFSLVALIIPSMGDSHKQQGLKVATLGLSEAEREAVAAVAPGSQVLPYLNRLSSLLWVQARWVEGEHLLSRDVPADSLSLSRAPQADLPDGAARFRARKSRGSTK